MNYGDSTHNKVLEIFYKHDPEGLIALGCPPDEYLPEVAPTIAALEACRNTSEFSVRLHRIFVDYFGPAKMAVPGEDLVNELWEVRALWA